MKKKIGILIILLIIILLLLLIAMFANKKNFSTHKEGEGKSAIIPIENGETIKYPQNRTECFTVINLANQYMNNLSIEKNEDIINIIPENYINEQNITSNNVIEKIKDSFIEYSRNYEIIVDKIYMAENEEIQTYFLDLIYCNKNNNKTYDTKLIINLNRVNMTYEIIPNKYINQERFNNLKIGDKIAITKTEIEIRTNNIYELVLVSKKDTPKKYFDLYLFYLKYAKEKSYYLLNKEYREKKFINIEQYLNYIEENKLEDAIITQYQILDYDDYTEYVCKDNNGRYYIFDETELMNFDVILDTYTIDLPSFIEKYNKAVEQQKVALNIDKFINAINNKDYKYAYSCLAESFKNNYFKTQANFENYIKLNFDDKNNISYDKFETQNNIYLYTVTINSNLKKTFIMQLNEGTEFALSFDI